MSSFRCIAVDMGASSIRIILGEIVENNISYKEIHRFTNEPKQINGSEKWDVNYMISEISKGINSALKDYNDIKSIGVDSWGVDYALLNSSGELVDLPYAYRDSRTDGIDQYWNDNHLAISDTFKKTGINNYPFNTLLQLVAATQNKEINEEQTFLFMPNYIYYALTGKAFNEITISSTSQLINTKTALFDTDIINELGIDLNIFAPIIQPGNILGPVNHPDIAGNSIEAVSVCSHDTASAIASIPSQEKDFLYINTGTWCMVGTESTQPLLSDEAFNLGITNERGINNTFRVLKNIVGLWLIQGIKKALPGEPGYTELEKITSETLSPENIINPDNPVFYNPDNMMEAFDDYFKQTGQPPLSETGEYLRCAYNSLGLIFKYYIEKLEALTGKTFTTIHMIGGGSQSAHLCQSAADFTLKKVVAGPVECATIGSIMVQGMAMNIISDLKTGREMVGKSFPTKVYLPQQSKEVIEKKYIQLKKLKNVE